MSAYTAFALQQGAIQTSAELEALIRNREVLSDQLQRVTEQRGELAQQRLNAEARANSSKDPSLDRRLIREYEQQIGELGATSTQLRRQIAQADEAIANAAARGVGTTGQGQGEGVTSTVISVPGEDFAAREALLRQRYESRWSPRRLCWFSSVLPPGDSCGVARSEKHRRSLHRPPMSPA